MSAVAVADGNAPSATHDAFISYSRKDKDFARKLDKTLKNYKPPRTLDVPQRHLAVFRDEEDFTGADYHASIARHLNASRKLLVLCSPQARASKYVDEEILRFAETRGAANIIPILVAGIPNNEAGPGQEDQAAFPDSLCQTLEMPLAIDYRGFDPGRDHVNKGAFDGAWFATLASLYDTSRGQVEQRERKRTARRRRITTAIVSSIVVVLAAALVVSLFYWRQAVEQRRAAIARQLAAQAELVRSQRPDFILLSVLLATESLKRHPSLEAEMALRPQLALLPRRVLTIQDPVANGAFNPAKIVFSADRKYAATATVQDMSVWELATGRQVARMSPLYPVVAVAFSPQADFIVTGSGSDVFAKPFVTQVWHLPDGRELSRMPQQHEPPKELAISRDGRFVATVDKQVVRVWDPASGTAVAALAHGDRVQATAFSPDGRRLATVVAGGAVVVWDVASGAKALSMNHDKGALDVAFSPDGAFMATSGDDTRMWRIADGREMFRIAAGFRPRFSPDGQRLTIDDTHTLGVYAATDGERLTSLTQTETIKEVSFQPDVVYAATTAFSEGIARIWKGRLGEELLRRFSDEDMARDFNRSEMSRVVQPFVDFAAFSPDASHFASGDINGAVTLWKSTRGSEVALMDHDGLATSIAFSDDGKLLMIAGEGIHVWELTSGRSANRVVIEVDPDQAALSPAEGKYLAVIDQDDTLQLLESLTGREVVKLTAAGAVTAFAFSPDGTRLATAGGEDDYPRVWEIPSGRQLQQFPQTRGLDAILFSPDGNNVATLSGNRNVIVVRNAATGQEIARIEQKEGVQGLVFSSDGRYLAGASDGGSLAQVWDAATGRERARVEHEGGITTLAFSPGARYLATGGLDSTVRIWNPDGGAEVARPVRGTLRSGMYAAQVTSLEFVPDGRLVVASGDGTASIWEPVSWREVGRISPQLPIVAIAVSHDGRFVATALADGVVRVSLLSPRDLIVEACSRLTRNLTQDEWRQYLGEEPYAPTCPNLPSEEKRQTPADGRGNKPQ